MRLKNKRRKNRMEGNGTDQITAERITYGKDKGYFRNLSLQLVCTCVCLPVSVCAFVHWIIMWNLLLGENQKCLEKHWTGWHPNLRALGPMWPLDLVTLFRTQWPERKPRILPHFHFWNEVNSLIWWELECNKTQDCISWWFCYLNLRIH